MPEVRARRDGFPVKPPATAGTLLALFMGMLSTYLTAFSAMAFAALSILTIKATVDRMWHLGE
jgi:hypothetical protein